MISKDLSGLGRMVSGGIAGGVREVARAVDALVFPWCCPLCERDGGTGEPFCFDCRRDLVATSVSAGERACPRCAMPVGPYPDLRGGCSECRGRSTGFDAAVAFGPYEGAVRELCLRMKREREAWLATWLARLMVETRGAAIRELDLPADTWLVPVPLHRWRQWRRGYNQAEALARGLSGGLGFGVRNLLRRSVATDRLADLSATDRINAMRGVFRVRSWGYGFCVGSGVSLKGRTVLLVDDVLTTGATSGAAARALKQAGAGRVVVIVVGRTL
jgi:ComF family protein